MIPTRITALALVGAALLVAPSHLTAQSGYQVKSAGGGTLTILSPGDYSHFVYPFAASLSSDGSMLGMNLEVNAPGTPIWTTPVFWDRDLGRTDWRVAIPPGAVWGDSLWIHGVSGDGNTGVGTDPKGVGYQIPLRAGGAWIPLANAYLPTAAGLGNLNSAGTVAGIRTQLTFGPFQLFGVWQPGGIATLGLPLTGATRLVGSDSLSLLGQGQNLYPVQGGIPVPLEVLSSIPWTPVIADISGDGSWAAGSSRSHAVSEAMIWDSQGKARWIGSVPNSGTSSEATGVSNGARVVVGNAVEFNAKSQEFHPIYPFVALEKDKYVPLGLEGFLLLNGFTKSELIQWSMNLFSADAVSADGYVITGRCRSNFSSEGAEPSEDSTKDLIYILTLPKPVENLDLRWRGKLRP